MTSFADLTTIGVGGPIATFLEPTTRVGVIEAVEEADSQGLPLCVIGGGSNMLVSDTPFEGVVVRDARRSISVLDEAAPVEDDGRVVHVNAEAGCNWDDFVDYCVRLGLEGVEGLSGIPGTVGGGVYMNAGAYGGEIRAVCRWSQEMLPDGTLVRREGVSQGFGYRTSVFQHTDGVIVRACFALQPGDPGIIRETMRELMTRRTASQPLDLPSAGSAFKRPQGGYAAALIESAGLKGLTVGGAQVSEKHAGFLINRGGASFADMTELISQVQQRVFEQTGVHLEPEVKIVG